MKRTIIALVAAAALDATAVSLSADGTGQALIYPYYTARSLGADTFNTYVSIVNHSREAKALRVRFREGRLSKETLSFNLFLGPLDTWVGAVVPVGSGARLVTPDNSCTDPAFRTDLAPISQPYLDFRTEQFADGAGIGIDRTQEGFIEVLEMAVLGGVHAAAATQNAAGIPSDCALLRADSAPQAAPPQGRLSGTLTLINVTAGADFTVNADALADLASRAYFRQGNDPYPDLNSAEIDAVSDLSAGGVFYRSRWPRPVDAVSAVLMRSEWLGEHVLDAHSRSLTDFVVTFPTRQFYAGATGALPPFHRSATWSSDCDARSGDRDPAALATLVVNREGRWGELPQFLIAGDPSVRVPVPCASAAVFSVIDSAAHMPRTSPPTAVLGSTTGGLWGGSLRVPGPFGNGWIRLSAPGSQMVSLPHSSRWTPTSSEKTGAHTFEGLPVTGFTVRTFNNGTLACGAERCQGNYGGAFPLRYTRTVTPRD